MIERTPEEAKRRREWLVTLTPQSLSAIACISVSQAKRLIERANNREAIEKQVDANVKRVVEKLKRPEPEEIGHCKHCKHCKHFVPNDGREGNPIGSFIAEQDPPADWGWCDRADSRGGDANDKTSLAVARDFELYEAHLSVSPEFGCVQFEAKARQ